MPLMETPCPASPPVPSLRLSSLFSTHLAVRHTAESTNPCWWAGGVGEGGGLGRCSGRELGREQAGPAAVRPAYVSRCRTATLAFAVAYG